MTANRSLCGVLLVCLALVVFATAGSGSDIVVSGRVRHQAVLQVSDNAPTVYETTTERYIVEAGPVDVGFVVPLDQDLLEELCKDKDGCAVVFQMVDRFVTQPGNVLSLTAHLFLSETSDWWGLSVGVAGQDDNDATSQWQPAEFDSQCRFSDAESGSDAALGFGLLNNSGGVTDGNSCRLLITD